MIRYYHIAGFSFSLGRVITKMVMHNRALRNFYGQNCFVLIVNFRNRFDKALRKIFQFRRALIHNALPKHPVLAWRAWDTLNPGFLWVRIRLDQSVESVNKATGWKKILLDFATLEFHSNFSSTLLISEAFFLLKWIHLWKVNYLKKSRRRSNVKRFC